MWRSVFAVVVAGALSSGCSLVLDWELSPDAGLNPEYCAQFEPNDTFGTATPILVTEVRPAAICPGGDLDYFRFTVPAAGQNVLVRVLFDLTRNPMTQDLDIFLYDAAGTEIARGVKFSQPPNGDETIQCPGTNPTCAPGVGLAAGDYVFEVLGPTTHVYNEYTMQLMIGP